MQDASGFVSAWGSHERPSRFYNNAPAAPGPNGRMSTKMKNASARGTFEIKSWDEKKPAEGDPKEWLSRGRVTATLSGDIDGQAETEFLMAYVGESAGYVGMQRVTARIGGRSGTFALQGSGVYEAVTSIAKSEWTVVPGSATGELAGLRGRWSEFAQKEPRGSITFEYGFE